MSYYYTTFGPVRQGCGHRHREVRTALSCIRADAKGCRARMQGGFSDRAVVRVPSDYSPDEIREDHIAPCAYSPDEIRHDKPQLVDTYVET